MDLEVHVERHLVKRVEEAGGIQRKLEPGGQSHWPDRLVILPGGRVVFVELKRPKGGRLSAGQVEMIQRLRALGAEVATLWSKENVDRFFAGTSDQHSAQ